MLNGEKHHSMLQEVRALKVKYYVTYGNWKPELLQGELEETNKAVEEWRKEAEEAGVKIVFFGSPYGVSESAILVYKGTVENYNKLAIMNPPYTDSRTHMVLTW